MNINVILMTVKIMSIMEINNGKAQCRYFRVSLFFKQTVLIFTLIKHSLLIKRNCF